MNGRGAASRNDTCIKNPKRRATMVAVVALTQGGAVIEQSVLLSEAHFAIEHVGRLKRLVRLRPPSRPLQRRIRALEETALRMEVEAKALAVRHWRAQSHASSSLTANVEISEIEYLELIYADTLLVSRSDEVYDGRSNIWEKMSSRSSQPRQERSRTTDVLQDYSGHILVQ